VDIVNLAFVNVYPDQGTGGWPGTNFGNACSGTVYSHGTVKTQLQDSCPGIEPGIAVCQAAGKKVLLSIGGGFPHDGYLKDATSAKFFADFLWGAFGPYDQTWVDNGGPRPFGHASVDGFDFDIESTFVTPPVDSAGIPASFGYDLMINELRDLYQLNGGTFYISGAPQCLLPDGHLSDAIANSWFDFIFVQLYNTPVCSARAAVSGTSTFPLTSWKNIPKKNPNAMIYMGLVSSLLIRIVSLH
jgi:chitinase